MRRHSARTIMRQRLLRFASALLWVVHASAAQAHPHAWVTTQTTVLFENGSIVGLREKWTFDQVYSAAELGEVHKNEDGKYDPGELAELAKADVEGLQDSSYFTFPTFAGKELKWREAQGSRLEPEDGGLLSMHFTLRLEQPLSAKTQVLQFSIYDPSNFIAFAPANVQPVKLSDGAPKSCKVRTREQHADPAQSEALRHQFGAFAVTTKPVVAVDCTGH